MPSFANADLSIILREKIHGARERLVSQLLWGGNAASFYRDYLSEIGEILRFGIVTILDVPEEEVTIHPLDPVYLSPAEIADPDVSELRIRASNQCEAVEIDKEVPGLLYSNILNNRDFGVEFNAKVVEDEKWPYFFVYSELRVGGDLITPRLIAMVAAPGKRIFNEGESGRSYTIPAAEGYHSTAAFKAVRHIASELMFISNNIGAMFEETSKRVSRNKRMKHSEAIMEAEDEFKDLLGTVQGPPDAHYRNKSGKKESANLYQVRVQTYLPLKKGFGGTQDSGVLANIQYTSANLDKKVKLKDFARIVENVYSLFPTFPGDREHLVVGFGFLVISILLRNKSRKFGQAGYSYRLIGEKDITTDDCLEAVNEVNKLLGLPAQDLDEKKNPEISDLSLSLDDPSTAWVDKLSTELVMHFAPEEVGHDSDFWNFVKSSPESKQHLDHAIQSCISSLSDLNGYGSAIEHVMNYGCEKYLENLKKGEPNSSSLLCYQPVASKDGGPAGLCAYHRITLYFPRIVSTRMYGYTGFINPETLMHQCPEYYLSNAIETILDHSKNEYSALLVPLFGKGQLLAVASIYKLEGTFSVDEIEAAESIASNLGHRIQEARDAEFVTHVCSKRTEGVTISVEHEDGEKGLKTDTDTLLQLLGRFAKYANIDTAVNEELGARELIYGSLFRRIPYVANMLPLSTKTLIPTLSPGLYTDDEYCKTCELSSCVQLDGEPVTRISQNIRKAKICVPGKMGKRGMRIIYPMEFEIIEGCDDLLYHTAKIELFIDYVCAGLGYMPLEPLDSKLTKTEELVCTDYPDLGIAGTAMISERLNQYMKKVLKTYSSDMFKSTEYNDNIDSDEWSEVVEFVKSPNGIDWQRDFTKKTMTAIGKDLEARVPGSIETELRVAAVKEFRKPREARNEH